MTALVVALLLAQNYQGYPVAPRTASMGGAASALGEGAGNTFYNPAALSFNSTGKTSVEVSGNIFSLDATTVNNEIGDGETHTRLGFTLIPSNISIEIHGLDIGPVHLSDRWGLGVSVLAPFSYTFSTLVSSTDSKTLVFRDIEETVYSIYNDISYRVTDELGLGMSVVAMFRLYDSSIISDVDGASFHQTVNYVRSEMTLGHALAFGATWRPASGLRLGLATRIPLQNVFAKGEEHIRLTSFDKASGTQIAAGEDHVLDAKYELPWRFNFGVAYERPKRFALAAELIVFTPYSYLALRDLTTGETLSTKDLQAVVNVAVGAELYLGKNPWRVGFYTDRSPVTSIAFRDSDPERIDRYAFTLGTNLTRGLFSTDVGLLFSFGKVQAIGYDLVGGTLESIPVEGFQWRLMATYSSVISY